MKNSMLSLGNSVYWPFVLVCICGVILVIISVLALFLIKEQTDFPTTWKLLHAVAGRKSSGRQKEEYVEVRFFRIGREADERNKLLALNRWCLVGSGRKADFCLDAKDHRLEEVHFKIRLNQSMLLAAAVNGETFVNGVPIKNLGNVPVDSGDLIRAGSYEYRVVYSYCEE